MRTSRFRRREMVVQTAADGFEKFRMARSVGSQLREAWKRRGRKGIRRDVWRRRVAGVYDASGGARNQRGGEIVFIVFQRENHTVGTEKVEDAVIEAVMAVLNDDEAKDAIVADMLGDEFEGQQVVSIRQI